MNTVFELNRLPSPVLTRIITYSDPATWWSIENRSVRALINSTSFRCGWVAHLAKRTNIPALVTCIEDIDTHICSVLEPVAHITGSHSWITQNFVRALGTNHPESLNIISLALLRTLLLNGKLDTASMVVQHTNVKLDVLDGQFVRKLVSQFSELWMLQWLATNGLDFSDIYNRGNCFGVSQLIDWVTSDRVELLQFLADRGLQLPVRSLIEYALGYSEPKLVEFLMFHDAENACELSWNDVLMMACTEASTNLNVFACVVRMTEPSIVWTFAALCLASHAMVDSYAYDKFITLRNMPDAAAWIVKSTRGRTPIECLCERLTYENLTYISPFVRDFIELGVSTANMPSIMSALCQ
ncbi:hypothetical protein LPJ58_001032 [Coemansia sp. RSA 1591]|nr:hypothetical protein LPJ58_001032 [Coemansia sp. RSA 1591]KAJ2439303.1 hypothetical protein IWW46_004508 [Coemansia sp. RSA 2440]